MDDSIGVEVTCKFQENPIKMKALSFLQHPILFYGAQGQVSLKFIVESILNSNSSEILLSWLSVSLTTEVFCSRVYKISLERIIWLRWGN